MLEIGKERLCGKVEVSARRRKGPVTSPTKQHAVLSGISVSSCCLSLLELHE